MPRKKRVGRPRKKRDVGRPRKGIEPYSEGIKVLVYEIRKMTEVGRSHWNKGTRGKANLTYVALDPARLYPYWRNNDSLLAEWLYDNFGVGLFAIRSWTSCKWSPTKRKFTKVLAKVRVRGPDSFVVLYKKGLSRYGFWRDAHRTPFIRERKILSEVY